MMKKPEQIILIMITVLFVGLMAGVLLGRHSTANQIYLSATEAEDLTQAYHPETESTLPGKLNINMATVKELSMLPGIGEGYAQRIVDYREKNGPFISIEDLMNIKGIGEKRFESISDYITVGG